MGNRQLISLLIIGQVVFTVHRNGLIGGIGDDVTGDIGLITESNEDIHHSITFYCRRLLQLSVSYQTHRIVIIVINFLHILRTHSYDRSAEVVQLRQIIKYAPSIIKPFSGQVRASKCGATVLVQIGGEPQ